MFINLKESLKKLAIFNKLIQTLRTLKTNSFESQNKNN